MKKLLLTLTVVFLAACKKEVAEPNTFLPISIIDNFDSYEAGGFLGLQSNGLWTTWTGSPGTPEDVYVSNELSFSSDNSIKFEGGGVSDVVLPFDYINSGIWEISFMMLIPEQKGGYFNLLHVFDLENSNWAIQCFFSKSGSGFMTVGASAQQTGFTFPSNTWFKFGLIIDIDNNEGRYYIDEVFQHNWVWSEGSMNQSPKADIGLSAINFLPAAPPQEDALFFIDDFRFNNFEP